MDRDVLQVFAATYVAESDNIKINDKLSLIDFIKEGKPSCKTESEDVLLQTEHYIESLVEQYKNVTEQDRATKMADMEARMDKILAKSKVRMAAGRKQRAAEISAREKAELQKVVVVAVVVAAIIAGSYMVYKRFFSKAAKACKGKSGGERKTCLQTFKNNAVKAQMSALNSGMGKCAKTKNPTKCKLKVQNKIKRLQSKIR